MCRVVKRTVLVLAQPSRWALGGDGAATLWIVPGGYCVPLVDLSQEAQVWMRVPFTLESSCTRSRVVYCLQIIKGHRPVAHVLERHISPELAHIRSPRL
jgi:hypothetical protein